jgi:hypothetical protein
MRTTDTLRDEHEGALTVLTQLDRAAAAAAAGHPATQDALVDAGFEAIEEQHIGPGTHERLHQMIGTLGPRIDAAVVLP